MGIALAAVAGQQPLGLGGASAGWKEAPLPPPHLRRYAADRDALSTVPPQLRRPARRAACAAAALGLASITLGQRPARARGGAQAAAPVAGVARGRLSAAAESLTDEDRRRITELFNKAVSVPTVEEEEATWTELIDSFAAVPEVQVRAISNRGNSRARQGKLQEAVADYTRAVELAPGEVDPYLNRGATYEALGRLKDALADYDKVLGIDPRDPAGWNNRGNALMGLGRYAEARDAFKAALSLSGPQSFAFAAVNLNLAEFELGNDEAVLRDLRSLLARYADAFPDARAAYALLLWDRGERVQAEEEWDRATAGTAGDARYRSIDWVRDYRRWPPRLRAILQRFSETTKVKVK